MIIKTSFLALFMALSFISFSQDINTYKIHKTDKPFNIEGTLTEKAWNLKIVDFTQTSPNSGKLSNNKIEIGLLYDNEYLYVAAKIYVKEIGEINKRLTFRDNIGNTDYFGITLDPFGKASEGYSFIITPAGVQYDSKYGVDGDEFPEWNAVWDSGVKVYDNHWAVEFRIPFNFLRFDKENLSDFKFNLVRFTAYLGEQSWWNHIDPKRKGFLNQFGKLKGLEDINPPINLSFYPFATTLYKDDRINKTDDFDFSAGLDIKYVHKNTYTFDVSIIPDFSQTTFDNEILNLSAFEVKFDENRQFFTEGTDLFNKSYFIYTRRIGESPYLSPPNIENDPIVESPNSTKILNLIKVTGRTKGGFAVGVLNGIVNNEYATYKSGTKKLINPLSNYNSIVLDQTLKNNSYIYLANSSVIRDGDFTDFNLSEIKYRGYNKSQDYSLSLSSSLSQHYSPDDTQLGYFYRMALEKVGGNFKGGFRHKFYDKNFDPNDFGFSSRNNLASFEIYTSYTIYNPFWKFNGLRVSFSALQDYYQSLWKRERTRLQFNSRFTFKNNDQLSIGSYLRTKGKDFFESRLSDRYSIISPNIQPYIEYITDTNDKFYTQIYLFYKNYFNTPFDYELKTGYNLNQTIGDKLKLNFGQDYVYLSSDLGVLFVDGSQVDENNNILYSERNVYNLTTELDISYLLNNKMGFSLNLRHLWAQVENLSPYYIDNYGEFFNSNLDVDFTKRQLNYNLFNLDLLYKWRFAPGSELSFNWQNALSTRSKNLENNYFNNLSDMFKSDGINTFSFKLVYYLDYNTIKQYVR